MTKILLVDDAPVNRMVMRRAFIEDYMVLEASNGVEAMSLLQQDAGEIAAVLLDLHMPEMDGFDVLRQMRDTPRLSQIPVVVIAGEEDNEIRALELGAIDYVVKPVNTLLLKHRIQNVISKYMYERKMIEASFISEMKYAAEHDALTGLYNRKRFYAETRKLLTEHSDTQYILICWNIDRFKLINELFGMETGDRVLRMVARAFERELKAQASYGRLENDHFVSCFEKSRFNISRIFDKIEQYKAFLKLEYPISVSFGVYEIDERVLPVDQMCDRANLALATIQGNYEKHCAFYDKVLRDSMLREQTLVTEMNTALESGQFTFYLQPIYSIAQGRPVSAEALVRWKHPVKGVISPGEFIPVFEKNGFIRQLDEYVWESVCRYQQSRKERGLPLMPISLNISRRNLYTQDLCGRISAMVDRFELDPTYLRFEITESAVIDNEQLLENTVNELKVRGFTVLMDDFGSGYSSLNTLKNIDFDILKIDMKFMENFETSKRAGSVLTSIVRMAKWIGMTVIAEGVETLAQVDFLRRIGCDRVQGYYFSHPIPTDLFEKQEKEPDRYTEDSMAIEGTNLNFDELFNGNHLLNKIFNSVVGGIGIYEWMNHLEVVRVNDGYYDLFGYTPQTFFEDSTDIIKQIYREDQDTFLARCKKCVQTHEPQTVTLRRYHHDGRLLWLDTRIQYLGGSAQRPILCITLNNVTRMREIEQAAELEKYSKTLFSICDEILEVNLEENSIQILSSRAYPHNGLPKKHSLARSMERWMKRIPAEDRERVQAFFRSGRLKTVFEDATHTPWVQYRIKVADSIH